MLAPQSSSVRTLGAIGDIIRQAPDCAGNEVEGREARPTYKPLHYLARYPEYVAVESQVDDAAVQNYVNRIGRWLALQTERPDLPWTFAVIDTDTVNAFAAPGGYIFVTRGLFLMLRNEAELAGVVGHEISHVVRRHHLVAIEKQLRRDLASDVAGMLVDYDSEMVDALVGAGMELYSKGLDRDDEFEADRMGVVVAARSGYDAFGLPAMLLILYDRNENDQNLSFLFSTHPPTGDRLARLDSEMQGRMDKYSGAVGQTKRFQEIQSRLRKK